MNNFYFKICYTLVPCIVNNVYFGYQPYVTLVCAVLYVVANSFKHVASCSH